jgi:Cd2+/Zn2+-exporting ATPase
MGDKLKRDSLKTVQKLKGLGLKKLLMLTGDTNTAAKQVADQLQLDLYYASLLPQDKVKKIEEWSNKEEYHGKVVFVGDGINDAPVLARADIGIAMGGIGSDAAVEAADVVIMNDALSKIPEAIVLARKTKRIVKQNIAIAFGVKVVVLLLGASGMAHMWEAVIADVGVALLAIMNSMRVIR